MRRRLSGLTASMNPLCAGLWFVFALSVSMPTRWLLSSDNAVPANSATLEAAYKSDIQPLVQRFCYECHSGDKLEADLDLSAFSTLGEMQKHPEVWQKINDMLASEQMPPPEARQPSSEHRRQMLSWVHSFLMAEAARYAGDPGPVVLRRLSNAEYTYTLRDITGVSTLDPAREFPVDSASGEGFTNVGSSLVMSPSLLTKYVDAAKEVASHAVLLPSGIRFSPYNTRRDWTNESLARIREFYATFSGEGGGTPVNLQGIRFDTNRGGRLPFERYFQASIEERAKLASNEKSIERVAKERGLSAKYLGSIWSMLNGTGESLLLAPLQSTWKTAGPSDLVQLVAPVVSWQNVLFKFNSVGQIGLHKNIESWLVPVSPLLESQVYRVRIPADASGEVVISLSADDAGDGNAGDFVVWERPRFVAGGRPDLLLKDVGRVVEELAIHRDRHFSQAAKCLAAAAEAAKLTNAVEIEPWSQKFDVNADSLAAWLDYLGIATSAPATIPSLLSDKKEKVEAYDFVKGWVGKDALGVFANSSDQHVRIPGNMQPHSVAVHPAPTLSVIVGWRSPVSSKLKIHGSVQHAHPECGNGVGWTLELRKGNVRRRLASGKSQGSTVVRFGPLEGVSVQAGDMVALVINPGDNNHSCDLTAIDLTLSDGANQWNLGKDVSSDILAGNPHADLNGNAEVWNFFSEPTSGALGHLIPEGSLLDKWQTASEPTEKQRLAAELERILQRGSSEIETGSANESMYHQLRSISGPFMASVFAAVVKASSDSNKVSESKWGLPQERFGKCPNGRATEAASLCVQAPDAIQIRLPADLVAGAEFVVSGSLHKEIGRDGSVRLAVQTGPPVPIANTTPFIAIDGSPARRRLEMAFNDFRDLFPPTLCYTQIVPVDEVVTLQLYYREDDQLRRLMLTEEQSAELDRMWNEHFYISHEPLEIVTAFTQLYQFATQDRADLLPSFEPLRQPIKEKADAFRQRLVDDESRQVEAVITFATKAYRRPLSDAEIGQLRQLYTYLRRQDLSHDEGLRLLLARVLAAPAFLYKLEKPGEGKRPVQVSDWELASRLSYFLWSTAPDEELLELAATGKLKEPDVIGAQARRMLKDERARRLAIEFGCHWLHIHNFDNLDEKSERHFPSFNKLRGAMYEESILVLTDLFQRDRSVLSLVDGDSTFLNEDLARHYGIPDIVGSQWRRVEGVRRYSRGSILSLASTLAKQSGASRTSPILRGNWLSEVILGEKLPRPPKNVPVLSNEVPNGLTERQLIARHSSEPACAKCHLRVDPFGFALEGFDAIGRLRTVDASGLPIDTKTVLFDGTTIDGLADLKSYLGNTRRDAFVRQFTKKLLGYSLGRSVQLSDEPLLSDIKKQLDQNDYRVTVAVESIVRSPQFQRRN